MDLVAFTGPASQAEPATLEGLLAAGLVLLLVPILFACMLVAVRWVVVR